jgi:transposase
VPGKVSSRRRTAQANQIRGLLAEHGIIIPQGIGHIAKRLPDILEDGENGLPGAFRQLLHRLWGPPEGTRPSSGRTGGADPDLAPGKRGKQEARADSRHRSDHGERAGGLDRGCEEFREWTATGGLAGVGPRQHSSGGKQTLLGISKRGDTYLRTLLIHGARAVIRVADRKAQHAGSWLAAVMGRRNKNVAAVALANKNARIVWALLVHDRDYAADYGSAA